MDRDDIQRRYTLGLQHLRAGRYREGWPLYEARLEAAPRPPLPYPEWRGEPLAGKRLLVWPEQGFGDKIQMARFLPRLRELGAQVTVLVEPALVELFRRSFDVEVIPAAGHTEFPDPDYWVMNCSLPLALGATLDTLPQPPYLRAPAQGPRLRPGARIGVMTSGDPRQANNANRSLSPEQAARLLALPGAIDLHPAQTGARDFADTAALVMQLDLVIAVDTAVVHLTGGLGRPVWALVPAVEPNWTWMWERSDTPWYPTMRLFRQPSPGDWESVIETVEHALGESGFEISARKPSQPTAHLLGPRHRDLTYNPAIFDVSSEVAARAIILTPEAGQTTDERWARETPYLAGLIGKELGLREGDLVIDHGCGVGRLSKELIERFGCHVLGVDISEAMRGLAPGYVNSPAFSVVSPVAFDRLLRSGLKADHAISVWVLQHCLAPAEEIERLRQVLKDQGSLFVANTNGRVVPARERTWANDGLDVRAMLAAAFKPRKLGALETPHVNQVVAETTFWGVFENS